MSFSEIIKVDMTTLVSFCAVAEELNFARAANRLCISQPPLSRRIRQLEALIGTPVFERTTRSVRLTPAGAVLYEHAQRVTRDVGHMLATVQELARGEGGSLSIGITPSVTSSHLISYLHSFRRSHPKVALDLCELDSIQLWDELHNGRIDVALMRPVNRHESVEMTVVHSEPLGFVTRREDARTGGRIALEEVVQYPLIGYDRSRSPYLGTLFDTLLSYTTSPATIVQRSRLPSILTLVEAGVGAAIVPQSMMGLKPNLLRFHAIDSTFEPIAQVVVARPMKGRNPNAFSFIGALLAAQKKTVTS